MNSIHKIISNPVSCVVIVITPSFLYFTGSNDWWLYQLLALVGICIVGAFLPGWRPIVLVVSIGIVLFSVPWFSQTSRLPPSCDDQIDYVTGVVTGDSRQVDSAIGLIKVEIFCKKETARRLMAILDLSKTKPKRFPWFQSGDRVRLKNVDVVSVSHLKVRVRPAKRLGLYNLTNRQKRLSRGRLVLYLQSKGRYYLGAFSNGVYRAVITADRFAVSRDWSKQYKRLGISHLFAISGLHVGLIYFWLYWFLRILFIPFIKKSESGIQLIVVDILCVVLLFLFLKVIGMPISAKRAFYMLSWLLLLKRFFFWQPLWLILLGTACLILLASPVAIGQLSFQLSFLSVAGIIFILPLLPIKSSQTKPHQTAMRAIVSSMIITGWLFLLNFPLINQITPTFSTLTILNNVVHISFFSMVFLPAALLGLGTAIVGYPFGGFPGEFYIYGIINLFGKCWEWLLIKTVEINQWATITFQLSWEWYHYIFYWIFLVSIMSSILRWRQKT